jgi:colanic acid biosynthesis glycosyl transferase WcaI
VSVVCAPPYYPQWAVYDGFRGISWSRAIQKGVSVLRCPIYIPREVNGLKRILHYFSFLLSSVIPVIATALRMKPDYVITIAPTLMVAPAALLAAKLAGAKTVLHVQDFEVEAGFATGQMQSGGMMARLAMGFGDWVIRAHDLVTSISPAMVRKLVTKRAREKGCYELRNWADIDSVVPSEHSNYRELWSITTSHVAMYSGSIARKQGIEVLIDTARLLEQRNDLTFIICGNGPYRSGLEALAAGLGNVQFHDLQPKERLGDLLNLATIHLLPQKRDAADLVLPSKLTNMLASGRPVVAGAEIGTGLAEEIEGCGIAVKPENAEAMVTAIVQLIEDPILYHTLGQAARKRAETAWSRAPIIANFLEWLQNITK